MEILRYVVIFVILFIVFVFGVAFGKQQQKNNRNYDGCLFVERKDDRDLFRWVFEKDLDDIKEQKDILIEVRNQVKTFDLEGKKNIHS